MGKINFYQEKYDALENFYGWIDQGSSYEIAVGQRVLKEEIQEVKLSIKI